MLHVAAYIIMYIIMVCSLLLNSLGIYCLRQHKGGNTKQAVLLGSISCIEIIIMAYSLASFTIYITDPILYEMHMSYFESVEISMQTIMFDSLILISVDRLLCTILHIHYKRYITKRFIKGTLLGAWLLGIASGIIMYRHINDKKYYYLVYDILVLIVALTTYINIGRGILLRRKSLRGNGSSSRLRKTKRTFLIPFLILTSFVLCNVIPDIIQIFHESNDEVYSVLVCLWSLHFTLDPVIYIFANVKYRKTALKLFLRYIPFFCYTKDDGLLPRSDTQHSFLRTVTSNKSMVRSPTMARSTRHHQNGDYLRSKNQVEVLDMKETSLLSLP